MKAQRAGGADSFSSKAFLVCRSERKSFHLEEDIGVEVRDGDFRGDCLYQCRNYNWYSQNHGLVQIETGICRSSCPLLKEGQLQR